MRHERAELRQEGDYQEITKFDPQEVSDWLAQARPFVEQIAEWLRRNAGGAA